MCRIHPSVHSLDTDVRLAQTGHREGGREAAENRRQADLPLWRRDAVHGVHVCSAVSDSLGLHGL